jgi:TonB family protein
VLLDKSMKGKRSGQLTIALDGETRLERFYLRSITAANRFKREISLSDKDLEQLAAASRISFSIPGRTAIVSLDGYSAALKSSTMAACQAQILQDWGIDPVAYAQIATHAAPATKPQDWVTDNDYPTTALYRKNQGATTFRLSIDQTGAVSRCDILISSLNDILDDQTCNLMLKRATFRPALTSDGKPVPDIFVSRFTFRRK